jgi:hypothetical protein
MTHTPPPTPDSTAVAAGNGVAIDTAGIPVLDVDGVTKSYPGEPPVQALREVNLTIGQGELVGIVGPSGSGKTTLLQLMGTLDRPTSGRMRITGLDVATMADDDVAYLRATRIGFIFQQFFLAEHASVLDNVADGLPTPASRSIGGANAPSTPWSWSAWPSAPTPAPPSSRAGNANGSRSPGRWSGNRQSCSLTSRPGTSTRRPGSPSWP